MGDFDDVEVEPDDLCLNPRSAYRGSLRTILTLTIASVDRASLAALSRQVQTFLSDKSQAISRMGIRFDESSISGSDPGNLTYNKVVPIYRFAINAEGRFGFEFTASEAGSLIENVRIDPAWFQRVEQEKALAAAQAHSARVPQGEHGMTIPAQGKSSDGQDSSQEAGPTSHWSLMVGLLGAVAVIGAWNMDPTYMIAGTLTAVYLVLLFVTIHGESKQCLRCRKWWKRQEVRSEVLGAREGYETVTRRTSIKNKRGEEIGSHEYDEQVHVVQVTRRFFYKCSDSGCGHEWDEVRTSSYEG